MPRHGRASSPAAAAAPSITRSAGLSPTEVASAEKSPPSIRVAEVITAVLSVSSLSRIWLHTWSGATCSRAGIRSPASLSQSTSDVAGRGHPLGGDEDLLRQPLGLGQAGVGLAGVGLLRVRRHARARGVAHQRERLGQLLGQRVEPARRRRGDGVLQRVGGLGQAGRPARRRAAASGARPARRRRPPARRSPPGSPARRPRAPRRSRPRRSRGSSGRPRPRRWPAASGW